MLNTPPYIDTFESQGILNYNRAIQHYSNLLQNFNNQLLKKQNQYGNAINKLVDNNFSFEKIIDEKLSNFQLTWETIYNETQKNKKDARKALSQLNEFIKTNNNAVGDCIDAKIFLEKLKRATKKALCVCA